MIVRVAPGRTLGAHRFGDARCDYCHWVRRRCDTYVVRSVDTGQLRQVGSACLELFLGVRPAGLWALQFDPTDNARTESADGAGDLRVPVRDVLAATLVVSDHGRRYVSRAAAGDRSTATADVLADALFGRGSDAEQRQWRDTVHQQASALLSTTAEVDEVLAAGRALDDGSDYAANVRALVDLEWVDPRHLGLIASLVLVAYRNRQRRAEQASWAQGYVAAVGTRIRDVPAVVTTLRVLDGLYGARTLLVLRTEDGRAIKWTASGDRGSSTLDIGSRVTVTGTVKAHDRYADVDQTVITRGVLTAAPAAKPASGP